MHVCFSIFVAIMLTKPLISKEVTIRDVADAAGVSTSLVSFVLNAKRGPDGKYLCRASQATAERIVETAKQLGYHSNKAAASLRSGFNRTIGVIVSDISNSCFGDICRKIETLSSEAGYLSIFGSTDDKKEKFRQLVEKFLYFGVDGIIMAPCPGVEDSIRKVMECGIPVVLIDRDIKGLDGVGTVCLDNELAGRLATRMLLRQGYRRVALLRYETLINTIPDRELGYTLEMKEHGLEQYVSTLMVARESMARDIVSVIIQAKDRGVEAMIFPSNTITASGVSAINKLGYSVPEDIAVVGFDQGVYSGIFNPHIPFIDQPTNLIAEYSFNMLLGAITGTGTMSRTVVEPLVFVNK